MGGGEIARGSQGPVELAHLTRRAKSAAWASGTKGAVGTVSSSQTDAGGPACDGTLMRASLRLCESGGAARGWLVDERVRQCTARSGAERSAVRARLVCHFSRAIAVSLFGGLSASDRPTGWLAGCSLGRDSAAERARKRGTERRHGMAWHGLRNARDGTIAHRPGTLAAVRVGVRATATTTGAAAAGTTTTTCAAPPPLAHARTRGGRAHKAKLALAAKPGERGLCLALLCSVLLCSSRLSRAPSRLVRLGGASPQSRYTGQSLPTFTRIYATGRLHRRPIEESARSRQCYRSEGAILLPIQLHIRYNFIQFFHEYFINSKIMELNLIKKVL